MTKSSRIARISSRNRFLGAVLNSDESIYLLHSFLHSRTKRTANVNHLVAESREDLQLHYSCADIERRCAVEANGELAIFGFADWSGAASEVALLLQLYCERANWSSNMNIDSFSRRIAFDVASLLLSRRSGQKKTSLDTHSPAKKTHFSPRFCPIQFSSLLEVTLDYFLSFTSPPRQSRADFLFSFFGFEANRNFHSTMEENIEKVHKHFSRFNGAIAFSSSLPSRRARLSVYTCNIYT